MVNKRIILELEVPDWLENDNVDDVKSYFINRVSPHVKILSSHVITDKQERIMKEVNAILNLFGERK